MNRILASTQERLELSDNWSEGVKTHWHPPVGFFKQSASKIAQGLFSASDSLKQAMARLDFYINRAGSNLSDEDAKMLNAAKVALKNLHEGANVHKST